MLSCRWVIWNTISHNDVLHASLLYSVPHPAETKQRITKVFAWPTMKNGVNQKYISNELDIAFQTFVSKLSINCGVISNWFWRQQQNVIRASAKWHCYEKNPFFNHINGSICRKRNKVMYVLSWKSYSVSSCVYFPRCVAVREIKTKITLPWRQKQFATWTHTSSSLLLYRNK